MEFDLLELYDKPATQQFTDEELAFLKTKISKNKFLARYCLYKKESKKGYYIAFMIDSMPTNNRRSGIDSVWETIATRKLSDIEYEEQLQNYGCNNRRYLCWYYYHVEKLIVDDLKYNIVTPEDFIKECKKRGYSNSIQLSFDFENFLNQ